MTGDNDIKFIKQVPLHPCDWLKCLTRDMNDDLLTINYVVDVNIDDVSDAETVNYTATPKENTTQLQVKKIFKKYKNLKRKINEKNKIIIIIIKNR